MKRFLLIISLLVSIGLNAQNEQAFEYKWKTMQETDSMGSDRHTFANYHSFTRGVSGSDREKNNISILPVLELGGDTNTAFLGAGVQFHGRVKDKFGYSVTGLFNYYKTWEDHGFKAFSDLGVVPGVGRLHKNTDDEYWSFYGQGKLTYRPIEYIDLELGRGKHHFGEGYRSLFQSDYASPAEYFKITSTFWRIQYTNLWQRLQHVNFVDVEEGEWRAEDKWTTTHIFDFKASKRISFQLFETVIWQNGEGEVHRGFDPNYLNPMIFYRPVEFSIGSPDNVMIGAGMSYFASREIKLYGQLLLDEFLLKEIRAREGWWGNKYAGQIGIKSYNSLGIDGLLLLGEFNAVRPFTFAHGAAVQSYGNLNQPLAHPFGANFYEVLALAAYREERFFFQSKFSWKKQGLSTSENVGDDIFTSYFINRQRDRGFEIGEGESFSYAIAEMRAQYLLSPDMNLWLQALVNVKIALSNHSDDAMFKVGIKSAIFNRYYDTQLR